MPSVWPFLSVLDVAVPLPPTGCPGLLPFMLCGHKGALRQSVSVGAAVTLTQLIPLCLPPRR